MSGEFLVVGFVYEDAPRFQRQYSVDTPPSNKSSEIAMTRSEKIQNVMWGSIDIRARLLQK